MYCKALGDVATDPAYDNLGLNSSASDNWNNAPNNDQSNYLPEVTAYGSSINWLNVALIAAIVYLAFTSKETQQRHGRTVRGFAHKTAGYARRNLVANL
jgi:hypothetical protein